MLDFLARHSIQDYQQTGDPGVRQKYGILGGAVGICLNLLLFFGKFTAGLLSHSISITADAFNNLSDAGSSILTLIGFKSSAGRPADNEHPFGHGRIEYIAGAGIALIILLVGFELGQSAIKKILHPTPPATSWLAIAVLICSILIKLWMSFFNRKLGRKIQSQVPLAAAKDSLSDVAATSAVLLGTLITYFTHIVLDGWLGLVVACFILYTGYTTAKDSLSPLLGQSPDQEFVDGVEALVLSYPEIVGIHDLIVHDYGPGRRLITLHAEVPCELDPITAHDVVDQAEYALQAQFSCSATIHMDPIATNDPTVERLKQRTLSLIQEIDPALSLHDFRIVAGNSHTNVIFDLVSPRKFPLQEGELRKLVEQKVSAWQDGTSLPK